MMYLYVFVLFVCNKDKYICTNILCIELYIHVSTAPLMVWSLYPTLFFTCVVLPLLVLVLSTTTATATTTTTIIPTAPTPTSATLFHPPDRCLGECHCDSSVDQLLGNMSKRIRVGDRMCA